MSKVTISDKGSHLFIQNADKPYLIPKASIMLPPPSDDKNVLLLSNAVQFSGESINSIILNCDDCGYDSSYLLWLALMGMVSSSIRDIMGNSNAQIRMFECTLTRPANKTQYTAGDVIGDVSGNIIAFINVAKSAGKGVKIIYMRAQSTDINLAGHTIIPYFYMTTNVVALADNTPFYDQWENSSKRVGSVPLTFKSFKTGSNSVVAFEKYVDIPICPESGNIGIQVEITTSGYTPNIDSGEIKFLIGVILTD